MNPVQDSASLMSPRNVLGEGRRDLGEWQGSGLIEAREQKQRASCYVIRTTLGRREGGRRKAGEGRRSRLGWFCLRNRKISRSEDTWM